MHASEGADGAPLDKGNPVIRPYIPISRPEHEGELVLIIKKYESGSSRRRALHQGSYPEVPLQRFAAAALMITLSLKHQPLYNRERIRAHCADRWRLRYHASLPTTRPCTRGPYEPYALYAALRERFPKRTYSCERSSARSRKHAHKLCASCTRLTTPRKAGQARLATSATSSSRYMSRQPSPERRSRCSSVACLSFVFVCLV